MIKLYAFTCGTVTGEFAHLMEGGKGDITVPIPVFLIEHPNGRALFDTGLHPDCQPDPAGRLGTRLAELFRIARTGNRTAAVVEPVADDMPARNVVHPGSSIGCDAADYSQCVLAGRAPRGRRALP